MQKTVCCKIRPTGPQEVDLRAAMAEFALGQTLVALAAWDAKCTNQVELHHLTYFGTRPNIRLGTNMVCNAEMKVAGASRTLRWLGRATAKQAWPTISFSPAGTMLLDAGTFSIRGQEASLWAVTGRVRVPMVLGKRQQRLLGRGEVKTANVVCKREKWYLHVAMQTDPPATRKGNAMLRVDVGENTLAATSEGKIFDGEKLCHQRDVCLARRRALQTNDSQSALQRLRQVSGGDNRHVRHTHHEASRQIVTEAGAQGSAGIVRKT